MKKEYVLVVIVGLFIATYALDNLVKPISVNITNPYQFLGENYLTTYPLTTASTVIKVAALFLSPLWLFSFIEKKYAIKGAVLIVLAGLSQLYALQQTAAGLRMIPIEWILSISYAGALLFIPAVLFFVMGVVSGVHSALVGEKGEEEEQNSLP